MFLLHCVVVDGGGIRSDGLLQVFLGGLFFRSEVHQPGSCQLQASVVPVTLPGLDENLVLHPGGVRQLLDFVVVIAGHCSRRRQGQRRSRAGRYIRRRNVSHPGYDISGLFLQVHQGYVCAVRLRHRLQDFRPGSRSSQHGYASSGVDYGHSSQFFVNGSPVCPWHDVLLHARSRPFAGRCRLASLSIISTATCYV